MTALETVYVGRIVSVREGYAFIGINSVGQLDGSNHGLTTATDIFLHQDECSEQLKVGLIVSFTVIDDVSRGAGNYRAQGAVRFVETELLPADSPPMEGFDVLAPFGARPDEGQLYVAPTAAQRGRMKLVDSSQVSTVLANNPAAGVPRDSSAPDGEQLQRLMRAFLEHLFPALVQFGTHFGLEVPETELEAQMESARTDHKDLGMTDQLDILEREYQSFLHMKGALEFMVREGLIRRDTIIPMRYLPDFFTAVPVWYHWTDLTVSELVEREMKANDPQVQPATRYFCSLFPNQNWADLFQMFNRRTRTLRQYKGDIIPPSVSRRIREVSGLFDHIVVMTPYHDVAGADWTDLAWIRSIDPYVVGFKEGVPYFFILARFSDSGTFPLFVEMVADTMAFLAANKDKLNGFNSVRNPYWFRANGGPGVERLGTYLMGVVDSSLEQFEAGTLFDWLRGESK